MRLDLSCCSTNQHASAFARKPAVSELRNFLINIRGSPSYLYFVYSSITAVYITAVLRTVKCTPVGQVSASARGLANMALDWLRTRLVDDAFREARSLTTALLLCAVTRHLAIDQRVVSCNIGVVPDIPGTRTLVLLLYCTLLVLRSISIIIQQ